MPCPRSTLPRPPPGTDESLVPGPAEISLIPAPLCPSRSAGDSDEPTLFDKIVNKTIPAQIIYEDEHALAFRDINPQGPVHFLVIPKRKDGLTRLARAEERHKEILGHLLLVVSKVAKQGKAGARRGGAAACVEPLLPSCVAEGLSEGYRTVINDGPNGCQSVSASCASHPSVPHLPMYVPASACRCTTSTAT